MALCLCLVLCFFAQVVPPTFQAPHGPFPDNNHVFRWHCQNQPMCCRADHIQILKSTCIISEFGMLYVFSIISVCGIYININPTIITIRFTIYKAWSVKNRRHFYFYNGLTTVATTNLKLMVNNFRFKSKNSCVQLNEKKILRSE